jgi:phosphopantetheinyl transferase
MTGRAPFVQCRLGGVPIFLMDFGGGAGEALERAAPRLLGAEEIALWRGFALQRKRRQWLAGRVVAKAALQASRSPRPPLPFNTVPVLPLRGRSGPVASPLGGYLSISHSHVIAAAAHAPDPIGVDIERLRAFSPFARRHFLSAEESRLLNATDPSDPALTLLWSAKEAAIKSRRADSIAALRSVQWRGWSHAGEARMRDEGRADLRVHAGYWGEYALALAMRTRRESRHAS